MAKRLVLLTVEHIVAFKSCKWRDTKERARGGGPPPPPRSIATVLGTFPLDTCHLGSLGRPRSQEASLPGGGGPVFGDIWEISSFQNGFCGGERTHSGEALALVVRLGYFRGHFALFAPGTRFGLTRLLVFSKISTFPSESAPWKAWWESFSFVSHVFLK